MRIPVGTVLNAAQIGLNAKGDADEPVRVAVLVDESATPFLIDTMREALVPQTTSALVRVERLGANPVTLKDDTDVAIVLSCGSAYLQARVQETVVTGVPTVVLAESSVEVPFIHEDTRMLGLIAATDKTYLLEMLARWILDRTDKATAFAAGFPFMRIAAAHRAIESAALANLATGALFFMPGADFPIMTMAQLSMMLNLASTYGRPLRPERAYEGALVVGSAFALRGAARLVARRTGRIAPLFKAAIGGAGTLAVGYGLMALYERNVDYSRLNDALRSLVHRVRGRAGSDAGETGASMAVAPTHS